ncbi:MAG: type II toxin-antitoxin system HipA family toxin YjjJ [Telluria sp.]
MASAPDLLQLLRLHGPISAGDLLARLQTTRPSFSRASMMRLVRALGDQVIVRGSARRTAYAARRPLRGSIAPLPLYRVDEAGRATQVGTLDPVYPAGCALALSVPLEWPLDAEMQDGWFRGLPYPLDDMRPQGFLGRNFARTFGPILGVGQDPARWNEDDTLHALAMMGSDCPGNLVLGDAALLRHLDAVQRGIVAVTDADVGLVYPGQARTAMQEGVAGSSAGGEFPKFGAVRERGGARYHALVKFSGNDDSPQVQRWSDLLVCEHLASDAINSRLGREAAPSTIYRFAGRTFLEVERFDRHGDFGRSAACTWSAIDAALVGMGGSDWSAVAARLLAKGLIDAATAQAILLQWHFGRLIANTDMHEGNLAFRPAADGMLALAPAYDMLPMGYAPIRGVELPQHRFNPALPLPVHRSGWMLAAGAALSFWQRAADDVRISGEFRAICAANRAELERLIAFA